MLLFGLSGRPGPKDKREGTGSRTQPETGESNVALAARYVMLFGLGLVATAAFFAAMVATASIVAVRAGHRVTDPLEHGIWAMGIFAVMVVISLVKFAYMDLPTLTAQILERHERHVIIFAILGVSSAILLLF